MELPLVAMWPRLALRRKDVGPDQRCGNLISSAHGLHGLAVDALEVLLSTFGSAG